MQGSTSRQQAPGLGAAWRRFALRWGWRAYALPVLAALTIAALVHGNPAKARPVATEIGRAPADTALRHDARAGFDHPAKAVAPVTVSTRVDTTSCTGNQYPQLILVSLSRQQAWMCEGQRQVYTSPVTTGALTDGDQTPKGSWRVQARQRNRYLVGPGYKDFVHYWVPFNGDFGFHDAPWQTMAYGSQQYRTNGSHGCVHMPETTMQWFYNWAKVNQTVATIES